MTRMKENVLLVCILASFLVIPFLPWQILMLTDFILVRVVLLILFLAAINISPQVGMLSLASISFLFIERNKRKVKHIQSVMQQSTPDSPAIAGIQSPETAPEQPAFDTPVEKNISFSPQEDSGDNSFSPVARSMNQKEVLPTESSNGSKFVVEKSFSWVNTDLIQQ
jgi:predicted membrane metal-binding protein